MSDIFISYKREEMPTAKRLAAALERYGWTVWWDPHLRVGEHFDDVIEKALHEATCVIVLWSRQSVASRYVRDEATYALGREKLIPVATEKVDPPFRFAGLQTAQLSGWDGSADFPEFLKLVDDIRIRIGKPAEAPAKETEIKTAAKKINEPPPKTVVSKTTKDRSKAGWIMNILTIVALSLFYIGAVGNACSNDDILALSALTGFPLSIFLIFQKRSYRIIWVLAPLLSFFIGLPYGHNYGAITKSPLFGLKQGTNCQTGSEVLVVLIIVVIAATIDHLVVLHVRKRQ